jgi:Domain of unknown function (DUF4440)
MIGYALFLAAAAARPEPLLVEMQRVEASRNAAIKAGDLAALQRLYAPSFHGIAASGASVDRETLFGVFKRNAGGDFLADSKIVRARQVDGLVFAEGRLKLWTGDRSKLLSDSAYLHVYRRRAGHWEMIEGASTPIPAQ